MSSQAANDLFAAMVPEPFRILGLKLLPLSLGHYFILKRLKCAYVSDETTEATPTDLVIGCYVCSMPHSEFFNRIEHKERTLVQKAISAIRCLLMIDPPACALSGIAGSAFEHEILKWSALVGPFDFKEKSDLFSKYIRDNSTAPKVWIEPGNSSASGSHWSHVIFLTLTGKLGFTKSEVLDMGMREALFHFYKHAEEVGAARIMTEEDLSAVYG